MVDSSQCILRKFIENRLDVAAKNDQESLNVAALLVGVDTNRKKKQKKKNNQICNKIITTQLNDYDYEVLEDEMCDGFYYFVLRAIGILFWWEV